MKRLWLRRKVGKVFWEDDEQIEHPGLVKGMEAMLVNVVDGKFHRI